MEGENAQKGLPSKKYRHSRGGTMLASWLVGGQTKVACAPYKERTGTLCKEAAVEQILCPCLDWLGENAQKGLPSKKYRHSRGGTMLASWLVGGQTKVACAPYKERTGMLFKEAVVEQILCTCFDWLTCLKANCNSKPEYDGFDEKNSGTAQFSSSVSSSEQN